jgi:hypothetical protein
VTLLTFVFAEETSAYMSVYLRIGFADVNLFNWLHVDMNCVSAPNSTDPRLP